MYIHLLITGVYSSTISTDGIYLHGCGIAATVHDESTSISLLVDDYYTQQRCMLNALLYV